jgi:1-acyl-sn-glycerol-3-phosphate acyltransferase
MVRNWLSRLYGVYAALILGGVVFFLIAPVIMLLPTLHLRRVMGRFGLRAGLFLAGIPFVVRGLERLPHGPCVVVSNHASYLDGPLLTAALPERFTFVVQHGAAAWPWFGWVIRRMGVTFINRTESRKGARQTRGLIRRLAEGQSLTVFAEGGFERDPGLQAFRKGAFLIATHSGVKVAPAVIRGTRDILGEGQWLPRWGRVEIEIFEPIAPKPDAGGDHRQAVLELRDAVRAVVLRHCGEPDRASQAA